MDNTTTLLAELHALRIRVGQVTAAVTDSTQQLGRLELQRKVVTALAEMTSESDSDATLQMFDGGARGGYVCSSGDLLAEMSRQIADTITANDIVQHSASRHMERLMKDEAARAREIRAMLHSQIEDVVDMIPRK